MTNFQVKTKKINGVTLYYKVYNKEHDDYTRYTDERTVCDIDIDPDISEINLDDFIFMIEDGRGLPVRNVFLANSEKVFPNITTIHEADRLSSGICNIPNSMFPNAKNLVYKKKARLTFTNVFYSDEDTAIDLKNFTSIGKFAFEGCKTTKIINTENICEMSNTSFENSIFMNQPFKNGAKMAGTILLDIDKDEKNIILSDRVTKIYSKARKKLYNLDTIYVNHIETAQAIAKISKKTNSIAKTLVIGPDFVLSSKKNQVSVKNEFFFKYENIEVDNNNPVYTSKNGVLYNKNMSSLILCPQNKSGHLDIPEGVNMICSCSFTSSSLTSIYIPGTVKVFEPVSFENCFNLTTVEFGEGIEYLVASKRDVVSGVFRNCEKLYTVKFPSTLKYIGCKFFGEEVIESPDLPDGLNFIEDGALKNVSGTIKLPISLQYVGNKNFRNATKIIANQYVPGLFDLFIIDSCRYFYLNDIHIIECRIGTETVFVENSADFHDISTTLQYKGYSKEILDAIDIESLNASDKNIADLVVLNYRERKNERLKQFIKENAVNIINRFINTDNIELLKEVLSLNVLSLDELKNIANFASEFGHTLAAAYILDASKNFEHKNLTKQLEI